jgi:Concanavalin A-like lectin/glucanases superfamily
VIPTGASSASFPVIVPDDGWLDFAQTVTVSAAAGDASDAGEVTVLDDESNALTLTVAPVEVWENDGSLTDVVSLATAAPVEHPLTVYLVSSEPEQLAVTPEITFPAGGSEKPVGLYPWDDNDLEQDLAVTLTASATGCSDGTGLVVVHDDDSGYAVELMGGRDAGTEQWVDLGAFPGFTADSDWAVAERFLIPIGAEHFGYQIIRGSAWEDQVGDFSINVRVEPDPQIYLFHLPMTMNAGQNGVTLAEGEWHTLVVQYELATEVATLYVDGIQMDLAIESAWDDSEDLNPLYWGGQRADPSFGLGALYNETDTTISHMAMWRRLLTPAEITAWDGTVDASDPALVLATLIGDGVVKDLAADRPITVHGAPAFYRP